MKIPFLCEVQNVGLDNVIKSCFPLKFKILVHLDALGFRVCCVQNEVKGLFTNCDLNCMQMVVVLN